MTWGAERPSEPERASPAPLALARTLSVQQNAVQMQRPLQKKNRKQRATFRLEPELAAALRQLPNQTAFVESVLREALGRLCPLCQGTGHASGVHLHVSNFKGLPIRRLDRSTAAQLKALVHLGRQLLATQL